MPKCAVHAAELSEIGQLARACDVTDGRKQRVLHEGTQQHVRAEMSRSGGGFLGERGERPRRVADDRLVAAAADRAARAVEMEERDAVGLRNDLRLVAARREFVTGGCRERCGPPRMAEFACEQVAHQRFGRRIGRFEHHEPVGAEHGLQPARERVGDAGAWPVGCPQLAEHPVGEVGLRERGRQFVESLFDAAVERQRGDRQLAGALRLGQRDGPRLELAIEHGAAPHLVPVVILGIDPEDRDGRDAVRRGSLARELDGRDCLQQREERSAEGTGLLARDDGDGVGVCQLCRSGAGGRRGAAMRLLGGDDGRHGLPVARVARGAGDGVAPRVGRGRIARIERRDGRKIERVVPREWTDPPETAHIHPDFAGSDARGRGVREGCCWVRHRHVLSQSSRKHVKITGQRAETSQCAPGRRSGSRDP